MTQEIALKQKTAKLREAVKNSIYPFLLENTESIEDAKMFASAVGVVIKQQFMNGMSTANVASLKLTELGADKDLVKRYNAMFELLKDYTISDALKIIEGMPTEIDSLIREENNKRKLSELKTNFL